MYVSYIGHCNKCDATKKLQEEFINVEHFIYLPAYLPSESSIRQHDDEDPGVDHRLQQAEERAMHGGPLRLLVDGHRHGPHLRIPLLASPG